MPPSRYTRTKICASFKPVRERKLKFEYDFVFETFCTLNMTELDEKFVQTVSVSLEIDTCVLQCVKQILNYDTSFHFMAPDNFAIEVNIINRNNGSS